MKKIALMAMGLAGVLASCGTANVSDLTPPVTNWRLDADVKDVNTGTTLKKGTYVICDNTNTQVQAHVNWTVGTEQVELLARGEKTNTVKPLGTARVNGSAAGEADLLFTFGPKMAPLSLDSQSIVVNPITRNVNVLGYTTLGVQTRNASGTVISNPSYSQYSFPVIESCTLS